MELLGAAATIALALALQGVLFWFASRKVGRPNPAHEALQTRLDALESAFGNLTGTVKEETQRAHRHRARAEEAERRHRKLLEEGVEFTDEGPDVHRIDGNRGAGGGVPPVREDVGAPAPDAEAAFLEAHRALMQQRLRRG